MIFYKEFCACIFFLKNAKLKKKTYKFAKNMSNFDIQLFYRIFVRFFGYFHNFSKIEKKKFMIFMNSFDEKFI